jgi:hypothetical protein
MRQIPNWLVISIENLVLFVVLDSVLLHQKVVNDCRLDSLLLLLIVGLSLEYFTNILWQF